MDLSVIIVNYNVRDFLGNALRSVAVEPDAIEVGSVRSRAVVVRLPLGPSIVERYGAPFLVVQIGRASCRERVSNYV